MVCGGLRWFGVVCGISTVRSDVVRLTWFSVLLVLVSVSVLFSPAMCLDDLRFGLGSWVATFWKRAAHSVNRMFSNIMSICYFGFPPILLSRVGLWFWSSLTFDFSRSCIPWRRQKEFCFSRQFLGKESLKTLTLGDLGRR